MESGFSHPNITEVVIPVGRTIIGSRFGKSKDAAGALALLEVFLVPLVSRFYSSPTVMEYYRRRKEFDVVITNHLFNEMAYPFAVGMPFITLTTNGVEPRQCAVLGNVLNPAYVPSEYLDYPRPYSLLHRLHNLYTILSVAGYWRVWGMMPKIQREVSAIFPDLPPLLEIERNVSLALLNSNFGNHIPVPLLPSQVEVGSMHCVPGTSLPQDLESWLVGAGPGGAVYISMGTTSKGVTMPDQYRRILIDTFRRLEYRVIWKYDSALEGVSANVLMKEWMPQQDILADPRVKLFITHGGLLGTQEAICHSTPLLALPIFADQPRNAKMIVDNGFGLALEWEELTVDLLVTTIKEVITNPKYTQKVQEASRVVLDLPRPPLETAVFWSEYVMRHRGAPHLRSPAADLSWVEFLMLDVLACLSLVAILLFLALHKLLSFFNTQLHNIIYKGKMKMD
ncbi:UDP-glycosyltransferase UGT5 [Procambarus clarkii]|uniref:UDP-glycosyltransferase UGT5 n=1 Tax=Procambarus clarkii TaxID=6728 RepID=UPI001E6740C6|nr:UDP-glycosyltransferase UGT5-like [Procambarus clarkii]